MIKAVFFLTASLKFMFMDRTELVLGNLALRQQHAIFARTLPHSYLRWTDRLFWAWRRVKIIGPTTNHCDGNYLPRLFDSTDALLDRQSWMPGAADFHLGASSEFVIHS
jgi:hypothetical protein